MSKFRPPDLRASAETGVRHGEAAKPESFQIPTTTARLRVIGTLPDSAGFCQAGSAGGPPARLVARHLEIPLCRNFICRCSLPA